MEEKIVSFVKQGQKVKGGVGRYICDNFKKMFGDEDRTQILETCLEIVMSRVLSQRKLAFHIFLSQLNVYEHIGISTQELLKQVLSDVGDDMNTKTFEVLMKILPGERDSFDALIMKWMKSSEDVTKIICAIDCFRKDLKLKYDESQDLCIDIFKRACLFLRYKKVVVKRSVLENKKNMKKLRLQMKVKGVKILKKGNVKQDVSIVEFQDDDDVLVKYKQRGHDEMLKFVIGFIKDCDAVKTLGRRLIRFLQDEDKLGSAAEVWTEFHQELKDQNNNNNNNNEFKKTINYLYMKSMYYFIRTKDLGPVEGMMRRRPGLGDELRSVWIKYHGNDEDLDTALKGFETKLQSLPNPKQYYTLPKHVRIECISDETKLREAEKEILKTDLLGVDAEWCNFMPRIDPDDEVSLLQLVTRDVAYLICVPEFNSKKHVLKNMLKRVFESSSLKTLCFSGQGDVKKLKAQLRVDRSDRFEWLQFDVDLEKFAKRVLVKKKKKCWSLSKLVDEFVGKPLDKSIRMTDWNRRPLTPAQQAYAAGDGYTLLILHDILKWKEEEAKNSTITISRIFTPRLGFVMISGLFILNFFRGKK